MQPASGQNTKKSLPDISAPAQPFQARIVNNIPVKAPAPLAAPAAKPPDEDEELDRIMADVGRNVDLIGKKAPKKHLSLFKHQPKPPKAAKLAASPSAPAAQPSNPAPRPTSQVPAAPNQPAPAQAQTPAQPAAKKSAKQKSAPVLAIAVTILVTIALIAAALSAYSQSRVLGL